MTGTQACVGLLVAAGVWLLVPHPVRLDRVADPNPPGPAPAEEGRGWMLRFRAVWSLLAGVAALTFLGGSVGICAGLGAAAGAWVVIGRAEPPAVRQRRESVRRDLPHLVSLLASALAGGADPRLAIAVVAQALPGPAADRLDALAAQLDLGVDPGRVWASLAADPALSSLGRALARAHETGAPVAVAVERLAVELSREARADVEDRARQVGVRAALPLGLCLLPAFILVGIVPLVGGLVSVLGL